MGSGISIQGDTESSEVVSGISLHPTTRGVTSLSTGSRRPLVLSAPALDDTVAKWKKLLAPFVARIAPGMALPIGLQGEQFSRDPAVGEAYFADPLIETKATALFGAETLKARERVAARIESLRLPTLVITGGQDTIIPPQSSLRLAELPGVERKLYPGLRHELHNEPEGEQVLTDIAGWIDQQLG